MANDLQTSADLNSCRCCSSDLNPPSILCGEVNAKNKMGGYIGYQKFSSFGGVEADIGHTPSMDSLVQAQCDI